MWNFWLIVKNTRTNCSVSENFKTEADALAEAEVQAFDEDMLVTVETGQGKIIRQFNVELLDQ